MEVGGRREKERCRAPCQGRFYLTPQLFLLYRFRLMFAGLDLCLALPLRLALP